MSATEHPAAEHPAAEHPAAERLAAVVRVPTVSSRVPEEQVPARFDELETLLAELYPATFTTLELEHVGEHGLLLRWPGTDPALAAAPLVLMAHQDVVPVAGLDHTTSGPDDPAPGWSVPPFAGVIRDGVVWGRGTLDDKGALVAVLEAVETLVAEGFTPTRDVVLSFGANEEIAGTDATAAAEALRARGVRPWLVLDEGGAVVQGAMPGVGAPTAVIGVAEKGVLEVDVITRGAGGHASTPVRGGATARLARAITRLEAHPFPARVTPPVRALLDALAPHVDGPLAAVLGRLGAPGVAPVVAQALARSGPETAALVRTTVAVTQLEGSPAENVLATTARAHLNVRISTGETVVATVDRLRRVVADDAAELVVTSASEPSPVSPATGEQWDALVAAVGASHPDAVVLPYVQLGASDSRFFTPVSDHVYRFSPFFLSRAQRDAIHGTDERLEVIELDRGVAFYVALLRGV